jgi:hypothetical protein
MLAPVSALDADLHAELEHARAPAVAAPVSAPHEPSSVSDLASAVGNQAFGGVLSRMSAGEGILPSGVAHPAIEAAITGARGGGSPLPPSLAGAFESKLGASVSDVRVHADSNAASLARAVEARAFATGTDIFFAAGEYQPGTAAGRELIAHEVAHTSQQRGAPLAGPLQVSNPGEPLEVEADGVARELLG